MSKRYHLFCPIHDELSEGLNHGEEKLNLFWKHRKEISAVKESFDVNFSFPYEDEISRFVVEHINCTLQTQSEYGDEIKLLHR